MIDQSRTIFSLQKRIEDLERAIRKHRGERGHDRCWLDDQELYRILGDPIEPSNFQLPERAEFLQKCSEYWDCRQPKV